LKRAGGDPFYLNVWYTAEPGLRRPARATTTVRARGLEVVLQDGTVLEDWAGQYYVNNVGTGREEVIRALAGQARRMSWAPPTDFTDVKTALTRDLLGILPRGLTIPHWTVGGSDGIEMAIRAARKTTGRRLVLSFRQSYHGDTMITENVSGGLVMPYGDRRPWAVKTPSPYDLWERSGRDWTLACDAALERAEATLRRRGPGSFAAFVVEPVMSSAGVIPITPDLARGIRGLCDRHGIKVISDEVVNGFGRTGRWFGCQTVGLRPDALVVAKGFTGGYAPLGAVIFERSWGEDLRRTGLNHGLTYAGHPLGCAAARAVIRILIREKLVDRAAERGALLRARLEALKTAHPGRVADVRGAGLLLGLQMEDARPARSGRRAGAAGPTAAGRVAAVCAGALGKGIRLLSSSDGRSLIFAPPLTVGADRIERLARVLDRLIAAA
jgi:taurine--2-oxoglutarate transaminase